MHLTDEQLNEYLDNETNDRAAIELHLSTCEDCSARLIALQELFHEIESLPELEISPEFAIRLAPSQDRLMPWPRSLTLTLALQAALAVTAILIAAPLVAQFLSPYVPGISAPASVEFFMQIQSQWAAWLDMLSTFQLPATPEIPVVKLSGLFMLFLVIGASLLWLIGNGLLLRNQVK